MKNAFVGDINDYRKYGLLRLICDRGQIKVGVCWMLRRDQEMADGRLVKYLENPDRWEKYDPELFRCLIEIVLKRRDRDVSQVESMSVLPEAAFYSEYLTDDAGGRAPYFENVFSKFGGADVIFFDPDNGLEVESCPRGRKGSSRYLYWDEVRRGFGLGKSLLIYQHFPRRPRELFIAEKGREIQKRTGAAEIYAFRTPRVVFFLAVQPKHREHFRNSIHEVEMCWNKGNQIVVYDCQEG